MTMDSSSEEWKLYYRKHRKPPPRQCKFCGVDVSKGQSYCKVHKGKRKRELGTYICGYEGCQKPREYWKRRCEEHSVEKMKKEYLNGMRQCYRCGCDIGKRKDNRWKIRCDDCIEKDRLVSRDRQREYYKKWFKNRYHNDESFRQRNLEYQRKYKEKRNKKD